MRYLPVRGDGNGNFLGGLGGIADQFHVLDTVDFEGGAAEGVGGTVGMDGLDHRSCAVAGVLDCGFGGCPWLESACDCLNVGI